MYFVEHTSPKLSSTIFVLFSSFRILPETELLNDAFDEEVEAKEQVLEQETLHTTRVANVTFSCTTLHDLDTV